MNNDHRVSIDLCEPELTPLGWGVRVGNITWTAFGCGMWSDDLSVLEHMKLIENLARKLNIKNVNDSHAALIGSFVLLPPPGARFSK